MLGSLIDAILDRTIVLSFDKLGYLRHSRAFEPADLRVSLAGRVCLVTGANAGLGRATAAGLAGLGAEVWLLCRSAERAAAAATAIRADTGNPHVHPALIDLADRAAVRAFVDHFPHARVDVLVNNAGVLLDACHHTADGLELTLATNLVGPFLLTMLLLPRLRRSADARVITVSSGGMYSQRLNVGDLNPAPAAPFDGVVAYARTKRAQVVLTELWAARLGDLPITFSSMHPGWADTPGVKTSLPRFWALTRLILRTPTEGADTIVWLAAASRLAGQSGRFWFDRSVVETHLVPWTREAAGEREALWQALQGWSGLSEQDIASLAALD